MNLRHPFLSSDAYAGGLTSFNLHRRGTLERDLKVRLILSHFPTDAFCGHPERKFMEQLKDRTDEELLAFVPMDGITWAEMGYRSRSEFVRWAERTS